MNETTHEMRLDPEPFEKIASGEKTVELRLFDEKRASIGLGDLIRFTRRDNGETVTVRVTGLCRFPSFDELYRTIALDKCGYARDGLDKASPKDMERYYPREEQEKYGVVGICVEVVA